MILYISMINESYLGQHYKMVVMMLVNKEGICVYTIISVSDFGI